MMATLEFQRVSKVYSGGVRAVRDLDLRIADGELMVIVGPSGCGKSTLLRLVAGLEEITSGAIFIGGRVVDELPPQRRNVAMVFQNYALYPHMTVRKNLAFPLRMMKRPRAEITRRVDETAELLGLTPLLERKPAMLSGGQRQRVAMGRAMVRDPAAFLMDEPLSNLDAKLRSRIRTEIGDLQRKMRTTMIYVTHDQLEAMTLGDRVAVLRDGVLQQLANPRTLYDEPANAFVAGFVGSPPMNLFRSALHAEADRLFVELGAVRLPLDRVEPARREKLKAHVGSSIDVGFRPETVRLVGEDPTHDPIRVRVGAVEMLGHETIVYFEVPDYVAHGTASVDELTARFAARFPHGVTPPPGSSLPIEIDPSRLRFFATDGQGLT